MNPNDALIFAEISALCAAAYQRPLGNRNAFAVRLIEEARVLLRHESLGVTALQLARIAALQMHVGCRNRPADLVRAAAERITDPDGNAVVQWHCEVENLEDASGDEADPDGDLLASQIEKELSVGVDPKILRTPCKVGKKNVLVSFPLTLRSAVSTILNNKEPKRIDRVIDAYNAARSKPLPDDLKEVQRALREAQRQAAVRRVPFAPDAIMEPDPAQRITHAQKQRLAQALQIQANPELPAKIVGLPEYRELGRLLEPYLSRRGASKIKRVKGKFYKAPRNEESGKFTKGTEGKKMR